MPMILLEAVLDLELRIKALIEGGELFEFKQKWHQTAATFHELLADLRPDVRLQSQNADACVEETPHPTPTSRSSKRQKFVISVDSDSEELSNLNSPASSQSSKKRRILLNAHESSTAKRQINPIGVAAMTTPTKSQRIHKHGANSGDHCQARFTLPQIREILDDGHFIPNEIDPSVTQRLVKISLKVWSLPLEKFLARTEELCREMFNEQIGRSFGRWQSTGLYETVIGLCDEFIKEAMAEQRKHAKRVVQLELDAPTAHNHEVLGAACQRARAEMLAERRAILVEEWAERNPPATPSKSNGGKWSGNNSGGMRPVVVTDEQLGVDPYSNEVCLMGVSFSPPPFAPPTSQNPKLTFFSSHSPPSPPLCSLPLSTYKNKNKKNKLNNPRQDIRGYYTYALTRFIDTITQSLKGEFFFRLRTEIGPLLKNKLGIMLPDASEKCAVLLTIDTHILERREQLLRERKVIAEAREWLQKAVAGEW